MSVESWERHLLDQANRSLGPWMSCDECFDCSERMAEALLDESVILPEAFVVHMRGCPACLDELQALITLVAEERSIPPEILQGRLAARLAEF